MKRRLNLAHLLASRLCLALLGGCGAPEARWPFPIVERRDPEAVLNVLRERTGDVRMLYAVLSMSFEMPERSGVAAAVVSYAWPGTMRMTAFKDTIVTSRGIFDILLTPDRYEAVLVGEAGPERSSGRAEDLGKLHPAFRALGAFREAVFLPGLLDRGAAPRVFRDKGRVVVTTLTPAGFLVDWELDDLTFGVRRARAIVSGSEITVEYPSYREVDGRFFPERFELRDRGSHAAFAGVLEELEVNPELGEESFRLER